MFLTITTPQGVAGCQLLGCVRQPTCAVTPWRKIGIQGQPKIPAKGSFGNKFTWQIWSRNLKQPFWFSCFNLGREQKFESFSFLAQTGSWPCATRKESKIDRKLGQLLVGKNKQSSSDDRPLGWCSHYSHVVWIQVASWARCAAKEVHWSSHAMRSADSDSVCSISRRRHQRLSFSCQPESRNSTPESGPN